MTSQLPTTKRDYSIDRLRTVLTAIVVMSHTAMTYGAFGEWFYTEVRDPRSMTSRLLTVFIFVASTFVLPFFFFAAGYFTPPTLDRKGFSKFLIERTLRLGIPLLLFGFILGPLCVAFVGKSAGFHIMGTFIFLLRKGEFINGPLWFAEALLVFDLLYCLWRVLRGPRPVPQPVNPNPRAMPGQWMWLLSALGVGIAELLLRQIFPLGARTFGLWLGNFAPYVFLFIVGITAWRNNWLARLKWSNARLAFIAASIALPILPIALVFILPDGATAEMIRGYSWISILLALWDPIVGWGWVACGLLWFRARYNHPSAFWTWLGRRAFGVYIFHAPVLVAIALFLRNWHAPPAVKFATVSVLACTATWLLVDPLVRIPGIRRII